MKHTNHKVGGKGRAVRVTAPPVIIPIVRCDCGIVHEFHGAYDNLIEALKICECGAMIRYKHNHATIEEVVKDAI